MVGRFAGSESEYKWLECPECVALAFCLTVIVQLASEPAALYLQIYKRHLHGGEQLPFGDARRGC